jgi:anti-sigma factor RsiW
VSEEVPPIGEDDLHAYVDGQLPAERRQAVEDHLRQNPDAARRVADFQDQRQAIRAAFASPVADPLPRRLSLAHIIAHRGRRSRTPWLVAASILFSLGIGVGTGWFLHDMAENGQTQRAIALLSQEALSSHVVYAVDVRHPVEVPGSEAPHLQQWLSNRLKRVVVAPDLSAMGYHLVGGRLLATEHGGAAALLMYDDANRNRISVLLRPMTPDLRAPGETIQRDGVNGLAWIANGLGIAVVAALPESDLTPLAAQIGTDLKTPG